MQKRYDQKPCPSCGQLMRKAADLCRSCYNSRRKETAIGQHDSCVDCGKPTGDRAHRAKRCWECWLKTRRSRPPKICSIPGCSKRSRARGLCVNHYADDSMARNPKTGLRLPRDWGVRAFLRHRPCQLCGYNRLPSHCHRLVPLNGYTWGNVVALCARCHEEVHRGLTAPPSPLKT